MQPVWHAVKRPVLMEKSKEDFCLYSEKMSFIACVSQALGPLHTWGLSPNHHGSSRLNSGTVSHSWAPEPKHA